MEKANTGVLPDLIITLMEKIKSGETTLKSFEEWLNAEERNRLGIIDERFKLLSELTTVFTVSGGYDHGKALDDFKRDHEKEFYYFNPRIIDGHFKNATDELMPGQKLEARFYRIKGKVSSEDCLAFYKANGYLRAGPRGLTESLKAVKASGKDLPKGKIYFCLDGGKKLWRDADGDHRVPYVYRCLDGAWHFALGGFEDGWHDGSGLLCLATCPALCPFDP